MRIERLTGSGIVIDATISPDGSASRGVARRRPGRPGLRQLPHAAVGTGATRARRLLGHAILEGLFVGVLRDQSPDAVGGQLYQIPILGGTPRHVLSGSIARFRSPDGRQFRFTCAENYPDRGASALMVAADGASPRRSRRRSRRCFRARVLHCVVLVTGRAAHRGRCSQH
jgi:hypothetical protein